MIKLSLALLEKQPIELAGEEPPELLGLEPDSPIVADHPIKYRLKAQKVSGGVLVEGRVATRIHGLCGRCLEPVKRKIESPELSLFFENPPGEELDLTPEVREELLLELPMNLLCSESCRGLCPHCGVNRNLESCDCAEEETSASGEESPWRALDGLELNETDDPESTHD